MKKYFGVILLTLLSIPTIAGATLYQYYAEQGLNLPSVEKRAVVASEYGIGDYRGTAGQNEALEGFLRGIEAVNEPLLGGTNLIAGSTYTIAGSGISSSATSITLSSFTIPQNGYKIQDSDLSDTFYITIEPGSKKKQEIVSCTTVTQNASSATLSGCTRGLSPLTPFTASSTLQFTHGGGSQVILSDPPQVFEEFAARLNDDTIQAIWTFDYLPVASSTVSSTATTTYQFTTKEYVDNVTNQGAATSSESVSGIVELATQVESASSTPWGADEPHVQQSQYASSTPAANRATAGSYDIWSLTTGFLAQAWINLTEQFNFTGGLTANQATTTEQVIGSTVPTNELGTGDLFIGGSATTTNSVDVGTLCFGGLNCLSSNGNVNLYATSTTNGISSDLSDTGIFSFTVPANALTGTNQLVGSIPFNAHSSASGLQFDMSIFVDSTQIASSTQTWNSATGTIDILYGAKNASNLQTGTMNITSIDNTAGTLTSEFDYQTGDTAADMTAATTFEFRISVQNSSASFHWNNAWFDLKQNK